ncbi:Bax inhibitor-1/YccA family protein [Microlunatus panaciterrae]|uniref:YccA/Bax inhibitor family protein n=1 Tax=Microlunatus panaciterrae TaxID=400768 RepID=A0ABS2RH33_9ACTN|nr:Bax inhibitor-1/YccA family protein [Microlunatus panaciterrae]MBM7798038.1 putative YccA/Bax inhibitor family protein [Microlunatus panaciterrae]
MLRSSNPILSKKDAFTPASPQYGNPYGQGQAGFQGQAGYQAYPQQGYQQNPYGQPMPQAQPQAPEGRMSFDDVVTKTAVTMAILIGTAALSWVFMPPQLYFPAMVTSGLVGFIVVMLVAFRRRVSPPLVLFYAALEGVFIGMLSKVFEMAYPGIVMQAVVGTFAAAGVTLAAYKFFNIRVTPKFRKVVFIATIAFAVALLANFLLSLAGVNLGLRSGVTGGVSLLAVGVSLLGAVLATLNLVLDFDYIERGVAMGAPASESWRGAFGLTVTMVWLYVEILRLLSYLRR